MIFHNMISNNAYNLAPDGYDDMDDTQYIRSIVTTNCMSFQIHSNKMLIAILVSMDTHLCI